MSEPIEIPIEFPEADTAQASIRALANAVAGLSDKIGTLGTKEDEAASAARTMATATQTAAQQQQAAATAAIAFGQRVAGAASAVQGLIGQLGGQSRTAGLIGASIQTSVQFAQMGAALGPGGALVGGITGALIPALRELILAQDDATESARLLAEEQLRLDEITQRMSAERQAQVRREVESHHILTLSQAEITRARLLEEGALHDLVEQQRHLSEAQAQDRERGDETAEQARIRAQSFADYAARIQEAVTRIGELGAAEGRLANSAPVERRMSGNPHAPPTRHSGGGGPSRLDRNAAAASEQADGLIRLAEMQAAAEQTESQARMDRLDAEYEANERLVTAKLRWQQELDAADKASQQEERERAEAGLEEQMRLMDAAAQAQAEHTQRTSEQAQSVAANLIGSMTDVIGQIAEGNATAEEGAKLMLAAFLQAMSQRAQIEALANVAMAISDAGSMNFAGMAAHLGAAVAWGAVAVATGVGGSAISNDVAEAQAARKEAERPASPRSGDAKSNGGSSTTVVNFNGPVMTAQARAEFGRMINEVSAEGRQRHPGM